MADLIKANDIPESPVKTKEFKDGISNCKQYKRKLIKDWNLNIDFRRGKPFASQSDEDRVAVNLDWSLTKQKISLLFSQIPSIRVNHAPQTVQPEVMQWLHNFEQRINDVAVASGIEAAMDECLPDCINASGIGVVMVSREVLTEDTEVPIQDLSLYPEDVKQQVLETGFLPDGITPLEMTVVPKVVDSRYCINRISPADFLWPIDFTGSDFNKAPWVGRSGRITWAEAVAKFKLDPSQKAKYTGEDRNIMDRLNIDTEKNIKTDDLVGFDEVFYLEHKYDPASKKYTAIHHLLFLGDEDEPVINEPWNGQKIDEETGDVLGSQKYAIQVLTLAYVTDDAIPPSDSAIGRPQVNELNKSRTQMVLQRQHNQPLDWFDVNRIDAMIQASLMKGTWKGMIPVQGVGTNVIGTVSRGNIPPENFHFDATIKSDLAEAWQVGQGQVGNDIETKAEVQAIQGNMQARIGKERAKTGRFYVALTEVLGGLLSIYEDPTTFGDGFDPRVAKTLSYSILADSTLFLDAQQRIKRLTDFINFTAKSGWINIEPILKEMATLSGLDPNIVVQPPAPSPPEPASVSLRLTGTEDMMNPLTLGFLIKNGQAPSVDNIQQGKLLIDAAVTPPPMAGGPPPEGPGPDGQPPMAPPPGPPVPPNPLPPPPQVGEANQDWSAMPRINKRVLERE